MVGTGDGCRRQLRARRAKSSRSAATSTSSFLDQSAPNDDRNPAPLPVTTAPSNNEESGTVRAPKSDAVPSTSHGSSSGWLASNSGMEPDSSEEEGDATHHSPVSMGQIKKMVDGQLAAIQRAEILAELPTEKKAARVLSVIPPADDTPRIYIVQWANVDPNMCGPCDEAQCIQKIYSHAFLQKIENQQMLAEFYMDNLVFNHEIDIEVVVVEEVYA